MDDGKRKVAIVLSLCRRRERKTHRGQSGEPGRCPCRRGKRAVFQTDCSRGRPHNRWRRGETSKASRKKPVATRTMAAPEGSPA